MLTKNGRPIRTLEEWFELGGPKSDSQWQEGRSAMEAARCWLATTSPALPVEVAAALASHDAFGSVLDWHGEPEVRLSFDQLRGEPRNTDLLIQARDAHGGFLLAVEAKADEPFGRTVAETLAAASERRLANPRSQGVERIEQLAAALFGVERDESIGVLRYQLLTAVAGGVAAAVRNGGQRVVVLVQEFRTHRTSDERHVANARDLDAFVHRLSRGAIPHIVAGSVCGPFVIPGGALFDAVPPLFIGKATHDLRATGD